MPLNLSPNQLKVLCLFVLQNAGNTLPSRALQDILGRCDAHCFTVPPMIDELISAGNIQSYDEDGEAVLRLTEQGKTVVENLKNTVPLTVREKAAAETMQTLGDLHRKLTTSAVIAPRDDGMYSVTATLTEDGETLIRAEVMAPTKFQAELIARNFRGQPAKIYQTVMQALTENRKDAES